MTADLSPPLVIAHRGASREAAENSPEAFVAAIRLGADMVELDVRRTRDEALVVRHGATVRGTPVAAMSYDELVRRTRTRPPLLETIVAICAGTVGMDIEIKLPGYEAAVLEAAVSRLPPGRLLFTSFEPAVIATLKRLDPAVRCGLLVGPARGRRAGAMLLDAAESCGADLLALHHLLAPRRSRRSGTSLLDEAATRRLPVLVWTVNGPTRMRGYLGDHRVAGIITDLPGLAVEARRTLPGRRTGALPTP